MKRFQRTSMGGQGGRFMTTAWTELIDLGRQDPAAGREELAKLLARYWKPVYCYLRRKGQDNESAKDLTQGFFSDVVLGRDLFRQADPAKGRFRTFLLTALDRYVRDAHRAASARKRTPAGQLVRLDGLEDPRLVEPAYQATPDQAFSCQWAAAILDEVLAEVRRGCQAGGLAVHWQVFMDRVVGPILDETEPPPLAELCRRHGMADETAASNMVITVKRRFQAAMRRQVRRLVASDDEVDGEIEELMAILAGGAGG